MKKTIFLMVLLMSALHVTAQSIGACLLGTNDQGQKCWVCVSQGDDVEKAEKTYKQATIEVRLCSSYFIDRTEVVTARDTFLIRQEGGKTFRYDQEKGNDVVLIDMTLEEGDVFVRPNGEVLRVEQVTTDANDVKNIYLKGTDCDAEDTWRSDFGSVKSGLLQIEDIPSVTIQYYLDNQTFVGTNGRDKFYYPVINNDDLKQMFYTTRNLDRYVDGFELFQHPTLNYRFEDDTLHIQGVKLMPSYFTNPQVIQCIRDGNNLYINHSLDNNEKSGPIIWGYYYCVIDIKMDGFSPGIYTIYNYDYGNQGPYKIGVEAICGDVDYRPFIEEGKVWKVGEINIAHSIDETYCLHYYYFDGDTVIMDEPNLYMIGPCKKMMCHDVVNDQYPLDDGSLEATRYVGAMYEQQKKVYIIIPDKTEPVLLYDFSLKPGETGYVATGGWTSDLSEIKVTSKAYVNNENYKGNYLEWIVYDVATGEWEESSLNGWMEGIGYTIEPIHNGVGNIISPRITTLMQCTVGDEVIYYNPDIIDGVNPPDEETKKRIDFTHVPKPRPKAPQNEAEADGDQLSGEYTLRLLDLNLGNMSDTYDVTITDDAGEVVYQKTVRTADVLALNIDISEWAAPSYTINVENDYEQYIGTFELTPTSIEEKYHEQSTKNNDVYDLQGRRVIDSSSERGGARRAEGSLPKGLYIKGGRKYLKR